MKQTKLEMKGSEKGSESNFNYERRQASVWGNVGERIEPRMNLLHQCH